MKLEDAREVIESELMHGASRLLHAKHSGVRIDIERWRVYVRDRERFLLLLDSMYEDD